MGAHLIDGQFQSDRFPTTPRGKVPLSVKDRDAQDLLWQYAERHRSIDAEFSDDVQEALRLAGYRVSEPTTGGPLRLATKGLHLSGANYAVLDPGIRDTVRLLNEQGFETTDSGDGVSKCDAGRTFDFPHVAAVVPKAALLDEAERMQRLLAEHRPDGYADWTVEASYSPRDGTCILFARAPRRGDGPTRRSPRRRAGRRES